MLLIAFSVTHSWTHHYSCSCCKFVSAVKIVFVESYLGRFRGALPFRFISSNSYGIFFLLYLAISSSGGSTYRLTYAPYQSTFYFYGCAESCFPSGLLSGKKRRWTYQYLCLQSDYDLWRYTYFDLSKQRIVYQNFWSFPIRCDWWLSPLDSPSPFWAAQILLKTRPYWLSRKHRLLLLARTRTIAAWSLFCSC